MKTLLTTILAAILVVALSGCDKNQGVAAPPAAQTAASSAPPLPPPPVAKNFDATVASLPADFSAHSPVQVYRELSGLDLSKGKFESEAVYRERIKALAGTALFGEAALNGVFVFEPLKRKLSISYDPEKQQFNYSLLVAATENSAGAQAVELDVRDSNQSFPGIDSYFADKGRKVSHTNNTYLALPSVKATSYIRGSAKVKADQAKLVDGDLSVLLVGRLLAPYAREAVQYPFDVSDNIVEHQRIIYFSLEGAWLVNRKTGEILSKTWTIKRLV